MGTTQELQVDRMEEQRKSDDKPSQRSRWGLGIAVIAACAFYRPLVVWANNAWDLSSPDKILLVGLTITVAGVGIVFLLAKTGLDPLAASLPVGLSILILFHWNTLARPVNVVLLGAVLVVFALVLRLRRSKLIDGGAVVIVAVVGIAPLLQVVLAFSQDVESYSTVELADRGPTEATGAVEDLIVVIVDSYPSLRIAEDWFDHETSKLAEALEDNHFTSVNSAWSVHTFSALSISSLLELQPVADDEPSNHFDNKSALFGILRGDSLVVDSLRSAGFRYTHIESGWDGSACGPQVDACMVSPWIDEAVWKLLGPSIARGWIIDQIGKYTVTGTMNTTNALSDGVEKLIDNGSTDFVFAHLLLPHVPVIVDGSCEVQQDLIDKGARFDSPTDERAAFSGQMACVDQLLSEIAAVAGPSTAMIITGDHGPSTRQQAGRDPSTWSDADIAERFSILLAYRMPEACPRSDFDVSVDVMRAAMECALRIELPPSVRGHLIGAINPAWVEPARMERIKREVEAGAISPEDD